MGHPIPESLQGVPMSEFVATPAGEALLARDTVLQAVVTNYCATPAPAQPELALRGRGYRFVGEGAFSQVWAIDDAVAIKASSPSAGKHQAGVATSATEDLIGQHRFMRALGQRLAQRTGGEIIVPDQYFALLSTHGTTLLTQQYMHKWIALDVWSDRNSLSKQDERDLSTVIRDRIIEGIGNSSLRLGLYDLGLLPMQRLHDWNVLIPSDTQDPETAQLCIIDQPRPGASTVVGSLAVRLNAIDAGYDRPPATEAA